MDGVLQVIGAAAVFPLASLHQFGLAAAALRGNDDTAKLSPTATASPRFSRSLVSFTSETTRLKVSSALIRSKTTSGPSVTCTRVQPVG